MELEFGTQTLVPFGNYNPLGRQRVFASLICQN